MIVGYYDTATGIIDEVRSFEDDALPADLDEYLEVGMAWYIEPTDDLDIDLHYIDLTGTPVRADRPRLFDEVEMMIAPDGVETITIPLPAGTVVTFRGDTFTAGAGGENFQFRTASHGQWVFTFEPPPPYHDLVVLRISTGISPPYPVEAF